MAHLSSDWYEQLRGFVGDLRSPTARAEAKIEAAKGLAAIARSDNQNDQMSQQNAIVLAGGGTALVRLLADAAQEALQWWVALAITQLVFANERAIESIVDFSVLRGGGSAMQQAFGSLEGADLERARLEAREHQADEGQVELCVVRTIASVLSNARGYTTDRVKYGCLHIATNMANKHWGAHDVLLHHGVVRLLNPIIRAGNTPALTAAGVALLCCMSYNHKARLRLIKSGVVPGLRAISRSEKRELNAISANIARFNLEGHAASLISALGRGFLARLEAKRQARQRLMKRLSNFFTNAVVWKCFLVWKAFRLDMIEFRAKMRQANALLFNRGLLNGFRALAGYMYHRRAKYEKEDRALDLAQRSLVARNRIFRLFVAYMYKEGPWWKPDAELEALVKEKCSHFLALMSGQWTMLTFDAWKDILVKKHRALKRWKNSALHFAFNLWVEYMCSEGPWWEPTDEVKKQLEAKCSHFMAMLSGDWVKNIFKAWQEATRKNKRAKQRWLNRALSNCFDLWFDDVFVDAAELYMQVQKKCSRVVAMIGGEMRAACFHSWLQHSAKMAKSRRFLLKIQKMPMVNSWENWVLYMCEEGPWWEPGRDLQEKLEEKCGKVLALLSGDLLKLAFGEWASMYKKNKRALLRWKQQSEHHMISMWKDFTAQERDWKRIMRTIARSRVTHHKWEALVDWQYIGQERKYCRDLVRDAISMWQNKPLIHALRSLDEHLAEQKYYREVVARFRRRFEMRPAARCLKCLHEFVERQLHMRQLMKRIKNQHVIQCLTKWLEVVQEAKIALKEQMCSASPLLMRWLKRPMARTYKAWHELYETEKRNRKILERMAYRLRNACVVAAFADWNVFVDVMVAERFEELKAATAAALQSGTMTVLLASLQRQHQNFYRRNVRWNDFVKTYLEDAVKEVTLEEQGLVNDIFHKKQRKKARLQQQPQQQQQLSEQAGARGKKGGAGSVSPSKKGNNKPSYAARFLPHRQAPVQLLPAYLQDGGMGRVAAEQEWSAPPEALSHAHGGSMGAGGVRGVIEEEEDFEWTGVGAGEQQALRHAPVPAARSPDRWGGGGGGKAFADRSRFVRGSGGQIAPSYMLRADASLHELDASVLSPYPCALSCVSLCPAPDASASSLHAHGLHAHGGILQGAGMWGAHDLRQRERELHREQEQGRKQEERRRKQHHLLARSHPEHDEPHRGRGMQRHVAAKGARPGRVSFGGQEERSWQDDEPDQEQPPGLAPFAHERPLDGLLLRACFWPPPSPIFIMRCRSASCSLAALLFSACPAQRVSQVA